MKAFTPTAKRPGVWPGTGPQSYQAGQCHKCKANDQGGNYTRQFGFTCRPCLDAIAANAESRNGGRDESV